MVFRIVASQFNKILARQVIGRTHIWHMTYIQNVTHEKIWETTKFGLTKKIKIFKRFYKISLQAQEIIKEWHTCSLFSTKSFENKLLTKKTSSSSIHVIFVVQWVHLETIHLWPSIDLQNQENIFTVFQIMIKAEELKENIKKFHYIF